ncbi:hypothetical protein J4772_30115 [Cohnella sp. LGH]|uniref:hypothetical protein n=1 Tax=Cohnella sp. LGH TaxID=1619153 RepID=UPI001ADBC8A5|nr:hypothetical protein [Cohnella sp. LGH]QTH41741.1 hypothetical protein J4772_30115 [Cohnella sp. LGH]
MKKSSANLLKTSLFLAILALALSACGGKGDKNDASPSASPSASATSSESPSASPSESPSASPSASPSESPSAEASQPAAEGVPAGYKLFEDKTFGTTIHYPEDWTLQENLVGIAIFLAPLEGADDKFAENVGFIIEDLGGQAISAADYLEITKQQLPNMLEDFEIVEEGAAPAEEGIDGSYIIYKGTQNGNELSWLQTIEVSDGKGYIMTYTASRDSFDKYLDQVGVIADSWTVH